MLLFLIGDRASILGAVSSPGEIHRAGMGSGTGANSWCGSKLSTLRPWDRIASFLVVSDLVINLNTCLYKFVKYIWKSDLVREGLFEFPIQALLKEQDLSMFINCQDCC